MSNLFIISDFHFDHANILNFKRRDSTPLRDFKDVNHMNEFMVQEYNSIVRPQDKVYICGDVAMKDTGIKYLARLNGHKRLVLGNHDYGNMHLYMPYFEDIYSTRRLDNFILSHFPIHPESLGKAHGCLYGHVHDPHNNIKDPRYYSVCVENLDYRPISLEEAKRKIFKQIEAK